MTKIAVVAFGGNALLRGDQKGYYEEQVSNVRKTCENLLPLIQKGYNLVIGHGNGPQVGNVMLQHEAGEKNYDVIKQPMHFCVAETQGSIAYLIEQQLRNVLAENGIKRNVICIVTQVVVDKNDQAFANPAKPVGPFYTEEEAQKLKAEKNWFFNADPRGRGMRRVVASPVPVDVCNWEIVEELAREGNIVVTVGGGGIPVIKDGEQLIGVDAVIDKDLASSFIANKIKADEFYILTDVPKVFINFNTPEQKQLDRITVEEANTYMNEGHFAEGSMAPKVRAAVRFVEGGGAETTITEATELAKENSGTTIYAN
jgi:carbamate kinase